MYISIIHHVYMMTCLHTKLYKPDTTFPPQRRISKNPPAPKCREWTYRSNKLRWRHPSWALPSHPEFYLGIISQELPNWKHYPKW